MKIPQNPEMVLYLAGVEIYRANLTPVRVTYNEETLFEVTKEMIERTKDGNDLWKAALGELGYQRPDRHFG